LRSYGCDSEALIEDVGSGVLRKTYENCDADVLFYDIEGMDHAWPLHEAKGPGAAQVAEYAEVDHLDETMKFFTEHPLPWPPMSKPQAAPAVR
jgi:poly(3-hydroxybutyrate) depolymerase